MSEQGREVRGEQQLRTAHTQALGVLPHEAASECLARDVLNRVGDKWSVYVIALLDSRCCQWS